MNDVRKWMVAAVAAVGLAACASGVASAQYPNPVVNQRIYTRQSYDPWNDQSFVSTTRIRERASLYDPARGAVDFGSAQYVSRYVRDGNGGLWLEQGTTWTSFGVPHGDLSRTRYLEGPGMVERQRDRILYNRR